MTALVVADKTSEWRRLKALVLDSVSSPITKRVYNMALDEFLVWFQQAPRPGFTKATVSAWRVSLEARGLACELLAAGLGGFPPPPEKAQASTPSRPRPAASVITLRRQ